ncbi:MAG: hypothetical protein H6730_00895 [Deltaproteobacteria bacterium]|nr:hypothetical protein [Deltaproteobacteria bacterium]
MGASAIIVAAVLAVAASAALGRINHAAFGLTVYGLVPLPLVDLTLGAHGEAPPPPEAPRDHRGRGAGPARRLGRSS